MDRARKKECAVRVKVETGEGLQLLGRDHEAGGLLLLHRHSPGLQPSHLHQEDQGDHGEGEGGAHSTVIL